MPEQKHNTINDIPQLEAQTKQDRLLLGLVHKQVDRLVEGYGTIGLELVIRAGKMDHIKITETTSTVKIGINDA